MCVVQNTLLQQFHQHVLLSVAVFCHHVYHGAFAGSSKAVAA